MRCGRNRSRCAFRIPRLADVDIAFQPLDFVQVNAGMNQRMIARALDLLDPQPGDRVLDLFCGLGNFTLPIARRAGRVVGVEGEAGAGRARARERRAQRHRQRRIPRRRPRRGPARRAVGAARDYDKLLLDPPRSGAAAVLEYLPRKADAAHRLRVLPSRLAGARRRHPGQRSTASRSCAAGVMDMFPHTAHVESIALFER